MKGVGNENDKNAEQVLYDESYTPSFLPMFILTFPVMALFWKYHVRVVYSSANIDDDDNDKKNNYSLSIGYSSWFTMKTIKGSEISSIKVFDGTIEPLYRWGGWGIRLRYADGSWQTGYVTKTGPGVQVTMTSDGGKKTVYVFSCDNPEQVVSILSPTTEFDPTKTDPTSSDATTTTTTTTTSLPV